MQLKSALAAKLFQIRRDIRHYKRDCMQLSFKLQLAKSWEDNQIRKSMPKRKLDNQTHHIHPKSDDPKSSTIP
eukprot:4296321-Amphidinium_carterae.1